MRVRKKESGLSTHTILPIFYLKKPNLAHYKPLDSKAARTEAVRRCRLVPAAAAAAAEGRRGRRGGGRLLWLRVGLARSFRSVAVSERCATPMPLVPSTRPACPP